MVSIREHHPDCTCKHVRPATALGTPHWADLDSYCPVHGDKDTVTHDLARFPQALNSYACDPCQHGDHVGCQGEIRMPDWSNKCVCVETSPHAHSEVKREAKRETLAAVIEAVLIDPDHTAFDIADALIEKGLL